MGIWQWWIRILKEMSPSFPVLLNQEAQKSHHKNSHKKCWVINLSQYLMWPSIVWSPLSCFDLQDLMSFSKTFQNKNKVRSFYFLFISPSQFSTKSQAVQSSCLCVCCNVCFEIEIWNGLKAVGHHRVAWACCIFSWFFIFQSQFVTNISSLAPVLTKFIKLTDAEPTLSCDPMQNSSPGPAKLCRVTLSCTGGMQCCSKEPDNLDQGRGVLQISGARCQSDRYYAETGMGEQSFLTAAFNSLEPPYLMVFLKSKKSYEKYQDSL